MKADMLYILEICLRKKIFNVYEKRCIVIKTVDLA